MFCDILSLKPYADLLLTFVLTVATVYLAVYTFSAGSRSQGQPKDLNTTGPVHLPGTGRNRSMKIGERGTFKEGMRFCPAKYFKKHSVMEPTLQYEKVAHDILLVATYKNALGDTFSESFHLLLKEQAKSWRMRPSDMIPSANGKNSLLFSIGF